MGRPRATHCKMGHEKTPENTKKEKAGYRCRICLKNNKSTWSRNKYETDKEFRSKVKERVYRQRRLSTLLKVRTEIGETFAQKLQQNDLYTSVNEFVPRNLNPMLRDDVIQSTILAVLEGEIARHEIAAAIKKFTTSQYKGYDLFSEHSNVKSLDADALYDGQIPLHETQNRNIWDM